MTNKAVIFDDRNACSLSYWEANIMRYLTALLFVVTLTNNPQQALAMETKQIPAIKEAIALGEKLWNDTKLSTNGKKCTTCHANGTLLKLDKAFPKVIQMAGGVLSLEQMINFCLTKPMAGKPFPSDSPELTAMAAYHESLAKRIP